MTKIKNVTIFDLETSGINVEESQPIEFGAILYSVEHNTILSQVSALLPAKSNEAFEINRIDLSCMEKKEDYETIGLCSGSSFRLLERFVEASDFVVAHCKEFDMSWNFLNTLSKPWLCTYDDFLWPNISKPTNLVNLALSLGVPVFSAHRAMADCSTIANIFSHFDKKTLQELFEVAVKRSQDEIVEIVAEVSYADKEKAKSKGFTWKSAARVWSKRVRASELIKETEGLDFNYYPRYELNT